MLKETEANIEKLLVKRIKQLGGKAYKWSSPGNRGVPDRLCFLPYSRILLVELKAPGKEPSPLQRIVIQELRNLNFQVIVASSFNDVETIYNIVKEEMDEKQRSISEDRKDSLG